MPSEKTKKEIIAKVFKVSRQTLYNWAKEGCPIGDLPEAVEWVRKNKPFGEFEPTESLSQAKSRKASAEARLKELQVMVQEGELIPRDESEQWLIGIVVNTKHGFLSLPRRLPPLLIGKTEREMEVITRAEVNQILTTLSKATKINAKAKTTRHSL